jgi:hypothetical protein
LEDFGEIGDEYDTEEFEEKKLSNDEFTLRTPVSDYLNENEFEFPK